MSGSDGQQDRKPKGVDLVQMEEDMENSRMDRLGQTVERVIAKQKAAAAREAAEAGNPPPKPAG